MLEIRNICKTYRAKSGVEVKALDDVSLTFPDHGMIFLLGKSGSGKSTLLNVIGGLDTFDSGELIIRGKSSRQFRGSDFDSYRNTFIGFIFQEYNILDEFSVGANIALALELQGKRATEESINEILAEVDLVGYGNRKPNELSGGQKQRIAIARALIKDPQIIMADEPTGALDSATGEQVLETLKRLSENKLVIVVSHDREFAETYGDRIIELADGCVISDTTFEDETVSSSNMRGMQIVSDTQICIAENYVLTQADLADINAYLATHKNDIIISRKVAVGTSAGRTQSPTGYVETKTYAPEETKFIRSRLPLRKAAKMGMSSIKSKPIRLMFTILLSLIAFSLFGFADTAIAYDKMVAASSSLRDTAATTISLSLRLREESTTYNANDEIEYQYINYSMSDPISEEDIRRLEEDTGLRFFPVYNGSSASNSTMNLNNYVVDSSLLYNTMSASMFVDGLTGVTEMTETDMVSLGFRLAEGISGNRLPTATGEVAIPYYIYKLFSVAGFSSDISGAVQKREEILGKTMTFNFNGTNVSFKVVGVIDTGFDFDDETLAPLRWDVSGDSSITQKELYELQEKLRNIVSNSFHTVFFAAPGTLDTLPDAERPNRWITWGLQFYNGGLNIGNANEKGDFSGSYMEWVVNKDKAEQFEIVWADGSQSRDVTSSDVVIPLEVFVQYTNATQNKKIWDISPLPILKAYFESRGETADTNFYSLNDHWSKREIQVEDGEGGWTFETRYHYAELLRESGESITDTEYENMLCSRLNQVYGWNLSVKQYQAIGSGNYEFSSLNNLHDMYKSAQLQVKIAKYLYDNYETYVNTIFTDKNLQQFMVNYYGWASNKTLSNYLSEKGNADVLFQDDSVRKLYICDIAAEYLTRMFGGQFNGESVTNVWGIDMRGMSEELSLSIFRNATEEDLLFVAQRVDYTSGNSTSSESPIRITGVYIPHEGMGQNNCVISPSYYEMAKSSQLMHNSNRYESSIGYHESGKYCLVICSKPADVTQLEKLIEKHYDNDSNFTFKIESSVMETLDNVDEMISILDKVFLGVGIGFAVFAALMMFNFISVSITNKKREIGILRAVGARSSDVFSIFFTEAFIIAMINFVLAAAVSFIGVTAINSMLRNEMGIDLTILNFGIRQVALLFAVSILVAFISSFLPVRKIASKTPIDAMKDR